jgi:hypothetical protein
VASAELAIPLFQIGRGDLGGGNDQRLSELAVELAAEHVEVVCRGRRVHDLPVVLLGSANLCRRKIRV